jgi:hypothetical protein
MATVRRLDAYDSSFIGKVGHHRPQSKHFIQSSDHNAAGNWQPFIAFTPVTRQPPLGFDDSFCEDDPDKGR